MVRYYQTYNKKINAWVKIAKMPKKRLDKIVKIKQREPSVPWIGVEIR